MDAPRLDPTIKRLLAVGDWVFDQAASGDRWRLFGVRGGEAGHAYLDGRWRVDGGCWGRVDVPQTVFSGKEAYGDRARDAVVRALCAILLFRALGLGRGGEITESSFAGWVERGAQ